MSTTTEIGELARVLQWKGEGAVSGDEKACVGAELADVLLNAVRLADVCGIDVGRAVSERLDDLAHRLPAVKD